MLGPDLGVAGPAEEFLEFLRVQGSSPNTVKSYARALALWWTYLSLFGLAWDVLTLSDVGGFLAWLRSGDGPAIVPISPWEPRFSESTAGVRLKAVTSCYRFHELNGVSLGGDLVRDWHTGRGDTPFTEVVPRRRRHAGGRRVAGVHGGLAARRRAGQGAVVNGITAEELMDCLETAGSRHDEAVLDRLWSSVPAEMRLPRLSAGTVPALYQGGFAEGGQRGRVAVTPSQTGFTNRPGLSGSGSRMHTAPTPWPHRPAATRSRTTS